MQKWKILAYVTAALLAITSAAALADGTDKVEDWWTEMTNHHKSIHGDDFETHHQAPFKLGQKSGPFYRMKNRGKKCCRWAS
jgi:predicted tellurium resistance membrane protein TerC